MTPLVLLLSAIMGFAPFHSNAKITIQTKERVDEVCLHIEGPEERTSCYPPDGITRTIFLSLGTPGEYRLWAEAIDHSRNVHYRTEFKKIEVFGPQ